MKKQLWKPFVKKHVRISSAYLILFLIITVATVPASSADKTSAAAIESSAARQAQPEWSRYSWGLYYKNQAMRHKSGPDRETLLKKAIQLFNEAASGGVSLDRIFYQLSECYFFRNDNKTSLEYAQKSLALDNSDIRIYNRIYNIHVKMKDFKSAAGILEDYLRLKPDSVQVLFILAEHYLKNMEDAEKASAAYRKVIALSDQLPIEDYYKEQSYNNLAYIEYRKSNLEQAAALYEDALNINKENINAIYYLALINIELYDLAKTEIYAAQFLVRRPDDIIVNSILGRAYYLRDDLRAVTFLGRAKHSGSMSGMLAMGLYYEIMKKDETALKLLNSVLKFAPRTISAHLALARINGRAGDDGASFNEYVTTGVLMYNAKIYEGAKRCFTEANRLNDAVPGVHYYLGKVYEDTDQPSLALYYFLRANELQSDVDLMLHIGYLYGVKKDYDTAIRYFNSASAREPANSRPYFFKGLMSIWQEDYPGAERHIQQAISLDASSETYYFYMAVVMEKLSKLDLAIDSLEKAIRTNPKSARAYNFLGYLYADNNMKIDESLGLIRKALELEPGNGAYTDSLGWVYFRKGDYRRALEKLLAAEEMLRKSNSPDPVVYEHIGDTYLKLGDIDNALQYWNRSTGLKKSDSIDGKIKKYRTKKNEIRE